MQVKQIKQEVIHRKARQALGQGIGREISQVVGDERIRAACEGSRYHVPVVQIRKLDGTDDGLPAGYERIREGCLHLSEQLDQVGV